MFVNVVCCKVLVGVTLLSQSSNLHGQFSGSIRITQQLFALLKYPLPGTDAKFDGLHTFNEKCMEMEKRVNMGGYCRYGV